MKRAEALSNGLVRVWYCDALGRPVGWRDIADACVFLTVPDTTLPKRHPGRLVPCLRPASEHPVTGVNRFTNHRNPL